MKFCCLLLLYGFLGIGRGWGQRVRGGFTDARKNPGQMKFDYYWFSGNRFDYRSEGCSFSRGAGTYYVLGDSLVLHYDKWPVFNPPVVSAISAGKPGQMVSAWDAFSQQPLRGVVFLKGFSVGVETDSLGQAQLSPTLQPGDTLVVSSVGYHTQRFVLSPPDALTHNFALLPSERLASGSRQAFLLSKWRRRFRPAHFSRKTRIWLISRTK